jgi:hypothetical protein
MSYLLFLDESGHDHKATPYEVRGGVALEASRVWPFIQAIEDAEEAAFGDLLHKHGVELKGHKLLGKDRFRWAAQGPWLDDAVRRKAVLSFLAKGKVGVAPLREEFTAYGQAALTFVRRLFELLRDHRGVIFAAVVPRSIPKPPPESEHFLRKDHVFLLERYFYFLEKHNSTGLLVMDSTDKSDDRRFVLRIQRYFRATDVGRYRSARVVPAPFFVSSDMTYPVQVADVCIYAINWGFRLPERGMDALARPEIANEFGPWLRRLQFEGDGYRDGVVFKTYGIAYVPDPYEPR